MENQCEQCTFLPDTAVDFLPTSSLDTPQLSLLSGMDMPAKSSENEQQTDGFQACECGKGTSDCLTHPSTPEAWTAFMQASLARTLVSLESKQAYMREPDQVFTAKSCGSLAWYDQSSSSWKTYQQSLVTDWEPYLETWPRWGMTQGGSAYAHPMSERRITETDGLHWPTPTCQVGAMHLESNALQRNSMSLGSAVHYFATPAARDWKGHTITAAHPNGFNRSLANDVKMFPTPTTIDAGTGRFNTSVGSSNHRPTLAMMAKKDLWPTPNASDSRDRGNMSNPAIQRRAEIGKQLNLSMVVDPTSGQLNPPFVEWLMGFPIGFTVSKDWVTPKSRSKQQPPTDC